MQDMEQMQLTTNNVNIYMKEGQTINQLSTKHKTRELVQFNDPLLDNIAF